MKIRSYVSHFPGSTQELKYARVPLSHANRLKWADWANKNSSVAFEPFRWPVSMNSTIQASVAQDPSGSTVADNDVQFVVNGALPGVIADFVANPPK
jgi:hypothetical protein